MFQVHFKTQQLTSCGVISVLKSGTVNHE